MYRFPYMPATHDDELVAIGVAALLVGVSVDTLRRWERDGRLTAVRTLGGHRRYRRADIEQLTQPQDAA